MARLRLEKYKGAGIEDKGADDKVNGFGTGDD